MGVEYRQFLVPADRSLPATPERLTLLIDGLVDGGWLPRDGAVQTIDDNWRSRRQVDDPLDIAIRTTEADDDLLLRWDIQGPSKLRDPAVRARRWEPDNYYAIEIHACRDYVDACSEHLDPLDDCCICWSSVATEAQGEAFGGLRLLTHCRNCHRPFDPNDQIMEVRNGFTGERWPLHGGGAYRFAVVLDCGKGFFWRMNEGDNLITLDPDFEALLATVFDGPPVSVPEFY
ncbi:MAG TPA: hypothetical protein VGB49_07030 [Caulobacteraceae bacterium]|jgi:hypothetical protein